MPYIFWDDIIQRESLLKVKTFYVEIIYLLLLIGQLRSVYPFHFQQSDCKVRRPSVSGSDESNKILNSKFKTNKKYV